MTPRHSALFVAVNLRKAVLHASIVSIAALASAFVVPLASAQLSGPVRIDSGIVEGIPALTPGVIAFEGIPFAAPPIGDLRWKAPQPVAPWPVLRNADRFGPACPQNYLEPQHVAFYGDYEFKNEDCLYLNLWTPAKTASDKLPVLVWIYGGGLQIGSGSERLHHGDHLAAKGVILVSFNYRLGILGFMAHPELTKESPMHSSGNYGLLDQIAAIQWVHRNIAAFGGDPDRITIFGESAGSGSVSDMQATPLTRGLLHGAIGESGASLSHFAPTGMLSMADGEQSGLKFAQSIGAASIAEMRAIPADQIVKAAASSEFGHVGAVVDGYVLPQDVITIFSEGKQNDIPVLVGSNANEGTTLRMGPPKLDTPELQAQFDRFYTPDTRIKIGDGFMLWNMRTWARLETKTGTHKAYEYYFSHTPPFPADEKFQQNVPHIGAFHSSEIIYVFNNLAIRKGRNWPWTPWDWKLADIMSSYWINFAATGDPNGVGLPVWPAYSENNPQVMNFDDTVKVIPLPRTEELQLWDKFNHFDFNAVSSTH